MRTALLLLPALGVSMLAAVAAQTPAPTKTVYLLDPTFARVLSPDAELKKVFPGPEGSFFEGPTWIDGPPGRLVFTDMTHNVIHELGPDGKVSVVVDKILEGDAGAASSVSTGRPSGLERLTGADGTAVDREGRITYVEFGGKKRVIRVEKDGTRTVLASEFEGKRFNYPDDLVYKSDGSLYFTDLAPRPTDEPRADVLPYGGVFRIKNGKVELLSRDYRPNGIAFSPDEKYLYITDEPRKIVRFDVRRDGTLANGQVFVDLGRDPRPGSPDGVKTDREGNVYTSGPGGVWIFSPTGKHLAELTAPVRTFINFAFGGDGGKTMYLTAPEAVYSLEFKTSRR